MAMSLIKLQSMKIIPTQWAMAKWQQISLRKILVSQAEKLWLSWAHTLWADYTTKSAYLDTYGPLEDKLLLTIIITSKFSNSMIYKSHSYISLRPRPFKNLLAFWRTVVRRCGRKFDLLHYFQLITRHQTSQKDQVILPLVNGLSWQISVFNMS